MAAPQTSSKSKRATKKGPVAPTSREDTQDDRIQNGRAPGELTLSEVLHYAGSPTARQILVRSAEFGRMLQPLNIPVVEASSIFRAAIAVGREPPLEEPTTANWLAEWLAQSGSADRVDKWLGSVRLDEPVSAATPLTNSAVAALGRAVTLASHTQGREQFAARHLIAALLLPHQEQMSTAIREDMEELKSDARGFLSLLVGNVQSSPDPDEKPRLSVWAAVASLKFDEPPMTLIARHRTYLTDYASDITTGADRLDIYSDVRSIAELICLDKAEPPLSIGLFGNWGSGKSFFMHKLQEEVSLITQDARREKPQPNGEAPAPFVRNIVQIQFNAWHYADANLWASLTAEFFDQLRVGGFGGSGAATHAALIKQVGEHIQSLESSAARITHQARILESKAASMANTVAQGENALARTELEIARTHIGSQIEQVTQDNKNKIDKIGKRLYRDDNFTDAARFTAAVSELRTPSARLTLILQSMLAGGWPTWAAFFSVCALAAFLLFGVAYPNILSGSIADTLNVRIASITSSVGAAITAFWGAYRFVRPMLDGVAAFAKDLADEKKRRADKLAQAQNELAAVQEELKMVRGKADSASAGLSPYQDFDKGRGHGTILKYFLYEDSDTKEYEKHIGLVSRARRSFQKLDEIIRAQRQTPENRQTVPDRIVLYIDDLDRCRYEQVVRVLEAVHLLLAFESIVVVVGVDARWIRAALAKYYQGEFVAGEQKIDRTETHDTHLATPEDYLQKIFQIPFWLQPFGRDSSRGYTKFVAALARGEGGQDTTAGHGDAAIDYKPDSDEKVPVNPPTPSPGEIVAAAATARERVTLTEPEVMVLSALAPLAGNTPRAIKRFVNLYRLIRARQREADFDRFVGQGGESARYPGAAFLLALETGQPQETIDIAHEVIGSITKGNLLTALKKAKLGTIAALKDAERPPKISPDQPPNDLGYATRRTNRVDLQDRLAAISTIEGSLERLSMSNEVASKSLGEMGADGLMELLHDIRRYSFHHHT